MNPSITSTIAFVLFSLAAMATAQSNFLVLRGDSQPRLEDLKVSNTPELLQFSALTGEKVTIRLLGETQTAIVQHHVNVVMDCSSFIESGGKLLGPVEWTRKSYIEDEEGSFVPKGAEIVIYPSAEHERLRAEGELNRYLNITSTNIRNGAERADNGLYTCTVCTETGCRTSSVMLFLIGAPPRLDFAGDNATSEESSLPYADKKYRVGADFCVERNSSQSLVIEITCDIFGEDLAQRQSIAFPVPSRKWYKDDVLLYSVDVIGRSVYDGRNPNFYTGDNALLDYGVVIPPPLFTPKNGQLVMLFDSASQLAAPQVGGNNATVSADVFNALTGRWRCEVENSLGIQSAETVITQC